MKKGLRKIFILLQPLVDAKSNLYIDKFISIYIGFRFCLCYFLVKEMNTMPDIISAIRDTIPISLFNRGFAGKIFEEIK